jgi:hypothetical protein
MQYVQIVPHVLLFYETLAACVLAVDQRFKHFPSQRQRMLVFDVCNMKIGHGIEFTGQLRFPEQIADKRKLVAARGKILRASFAVGDKVAVVDLGQLFISEIILSRAHELRSLRTVRGRLPLRLISPSSTISARAGTISEK